MKNCDCQCAERPDNFTPSPDTIRILAEDHRFCEMPAKFRWTMQWAADEIERLRSSLSGSPSESVKIRQQMEDLRDTPATPSACTPEPVAWGVMRVGGRWVSIVNNAVQAETSRQSFDKAENWVHRVVPLYRSPTLADGERERTNHDAAPAATAVSDEDRTDKAATSHRRDRPGDTPVAESATTGCDDRPQPVKDGDSDRSYPIGIDPAAYNGDIVSRLRHWRGLHLAHNGELFEAAADEIERLRTVMYRVVDEDCTVAIQNGTFYADDEPLFAISGTTKPRNGAVRGPDPDSRAWETQGHTHDSQTTPSECSTRGEGTSEPVAWLVRGCEYGTGCEYQFVTLLKEHADAAAKHGGKAAPLHLHPQSVVAESATTALTNGEREAILRAVDIYEMHWRLEDESKAATLRGLLERSK